MAKPLKCGGNQRRGKRCCGRMHCIQRLESAETAYPWRDAAADRAVAYAPANSADRRRRSLHVGVGPLRMHAMPCHAMPCHAKPSRAKRLAVQYLEVGEVAELIGYAADVRAITDRSASAVQSTAQLYSAAHTMLTAGRSVIGNVQARQPRQLADRVWYLTTQKVSVKLSARVRTVRSNGIAAIAKHQPALLARVAGSTSYSAYVQS